MSQLGLYQGPQLLHDVQMLLYCFRPHSELGVCPHASDTGSQDLSKHN